jgi:hypothetical protein
MYVHRHTEGATAMTLPTRFDIRALADLIVREMDHGNDTTTAVLAARDRRRAAITRQAADAAKDDEHDAVAEARRSETRMRHYRLAWTVLTGLTGEDADAAVIAVHETRGYVAHYSDLTD